MIDIAKGALAGSWALITGWILPCALGLFVFGVVVLPGLREVTFLDDVATASKTNQALLLLVSSVVGGLVLSSLQTPLYRILEGYLLWPERWQEQRRKTHRRNRDRLNQKMVAASTQLEGSLRLEPVERYPYEDDQILPTLLGNGLRRIEYYGQNRYQLDSQLLWHQLRAVVPESLVKEVDYARAGVDFFVCAIYVQVILISTCVAGIIMTDSEQLRMVLTIVFAAAGSVLSYRWAVTATDNVADAVHALVDVGRLPLAKALGLTIPPTLIEERAMWLRVGWLLKYRYTDNAAVALDPYRESAALEPPPEATHSRRRSLWRRICGDSGIIT